MKYILNSSEMQRCDANTSRHFKMPPIVLMERAAMAFVEELAAKKTDLSNVLVVCGPGNNGGDGLAIARLLMQQKANVTVVCVGDETRATEQNRLQREILTAYGVKIHKKITEQKYTAVVDAVFGIGLKRNIAGEMAQVIAQMNRLPGTKAAVDIASGVSADDGSILGICFCADITVTFAYAKIGMLLWPGNEYSGKVVVKEIGIDDNGFLGEMPKVCALEKSDIFGLLPKRSDHSNKGTFGRLLLAAGSVNMAGAAVLSAKAAYAAGCGLVKVVTSEENRIILQTTVPEAVLETYDKDKSDMDFTDLYEWADAIVIGPGIGDGAAARNIVTAALQQKKKPVLFDADALNLISKEENLKNQLSVNHIITPHLGEMARLTGKKIADIQNNLIDVAEKFSDQYHAVCVLKDFRTVTAVPKEHIYINGTGNSGMATAGSGDVLSGITGALLAQGISVSVAAPLGVYLHGMAGDLTAQEISKPGMTAMDLTKGMKKVWEVF